MRVVSRLLRSGGLIAAVSIAACGVGLAQSSPQPQATAKQGEPQQAAPNEAEAPPPEIKQIPLSTEQIEGVISAQKEIDTITEKLPENTAPDEKMMVQLDMEVKKYGFSSYEQYSNVVDNISLVLGGFDTVTKKYVGAEAVIKSQIAALEADKKMPEKDRKAALDDLNEGLKSPPPAVANAANIDLVGKYYDKLISTFDDEQD